ncbi:hypothetical protein SS1G_05133 [Sclerotinia sclerotiorum 1980 UF-70]|uniref:RING-type domain-containing protein n=1 Tax=Sclerotinia sclerotiorum (strain ATCC 18683 / 1980 / Ss-1) TaxID=665079 RepID=A7EIJ0_SCLS1|nr:hypothetical protein SS1G_05133 [Sclerotinia sclerotiorum 1980 UF-70]EDO02656.1 hypothetical protein SS1G_05133 [Sclerotinia sclerotiorum 1980 UF-70]
MADDNTDEDDPQTFLGCGLPEYDRNVLLSCIRGDPNFTNCLGPECGGGQIHEDSDDQPIMTCGACGFKTCFTHKMPWHTGLTCNQYNTRERERLQQEEASLQLMEKATKQCPQCQVDLASMNSAGSVLLIMS